MRTPGLASLFLLLTLTTGDAGSIERVAPTADDLARELGIEMVKFHAKFEVPHYCTLRIEYKVAGTEKPRVLSESSPHPLADHNILFTLKELGLVQARTGGDSAKEALGLVDFSALFSGTGFIYRETSPFGPLKLRQKHRTWTRRQSFEDLPLDRPVPLYVKAGPFPDDSDTGIKNTLTEYTKAPGWIKVTVTFSRNPPPPADGEAKRPGTPANGGGSADGKTPKADKKQGDANNP